MASGDRTFNQRAGRWVERLSTRLEEAEQLDRPAQLLGSALGAVLPAGPVQDTLSGTQIGHPVHPALVALPIGSWFAASVLDLTDGDADAAQRAVGLGLLTALPTSLTGASDWLFVEGAERRVGLVHAAANYAALGLQFARWTARRRGRRGTGTALTLIANGVMAVGGWLGGHLAYALGVGVDTTVFEHLPEEWTDVAAETDVPADGAASAEAGAVPILLARVDGRIVAVADRCTHRGAPLHEGDVEDGCVTCPWHASVFDLRDGSVRSGPASRPQPALDKKKF